MPYIESGARAKFNDSLRVITSRVRGPGELNYCMTKLAHGYREKNGRSFFTFCVIMGVFITAMLEFYRRRVAPYEDEKIKENGDV